MKDELELNDKGPSRHCVNKPHKNLRAHISGQRALFYLTAMFRSDTVFLKPSFFSFSFEMFLYDIAAVKTLVHHQM